MAKYWGIPIVRDIENRILIDQRIDGQFTVTNNIQGIKVEIGVFHPADILDEADKSLPKKFKSLISKKYTNERIYITQSVKNYLVRMEARLKKK